MTKATNDDDDESYDDFDIPSKFDHGEEEDNDEEVELNPKIDERDVVALNEGNFSDFIESNKYVMVEFYKPWCGHCKALAAEYAAAAATELKKLETEKVALAKVAATEENELAEQYEMQGFPSVFFFADGEHEPYSGQRSKDAIVTWIKKKKGPGVGNITTVEDAERILTSEDKVIFRFHNSLVGNESEKLAAASKLDDDVKFYQTVNPDVAKLFHIEPNTKRPALILLKNVAEKVTPLDGEFTKSAIIEFLSANKLPLVTTFKRESAPLIFESPIKKQLLLFAISSDSGKVVPTFQAAKDFKGKLIFVYVEMDNEDTGKPVASYFGIEGNAPRVIGYTGNDDAKKYVLDGELTLEKIKAFGAYFLEDKLKPFYKSEPIPETIYAPCGHCQALKPTYNKLAKHLHGIESLVMAKMDGTTNEHPRAKVDGFPTLLFFPSGNKSSDPISVETDRTVVAFYKFLKKHASIPFKLQKPTFIPTSEGSDAKEGTKSSTADVKDEL